MSCSRYTVRCERFVTHLASLIACSLSLQRKYQPRPHVSARRPRRISVCPPEQWLITHASSPSVHPRSANGHPNRRTLGRTDGVPHQAPDRQRAFPICLLDAFLILLPSNYGWYDTLSSSFSRRSLRRRCRPGSRPTIPRSLPRSGPRRTRLPMYVPNASAALVAFCKR